MKNLNRRKRKIRAKIKETGRGIKLVVSRSNKHMLVQLINAIEGKTLASVFTKKLKLKANQTKTDQAKQAGKEIAKMALRLGVKKVVFDRSGYLYHGRVRAVAEGAREGGLKF